MTKQVKTVNLNDSLFEVRDLMLAEGFRHVPVMKGDKLVGILSKTDIMRLSFGSVFAGQESADNAVYEMLSIDQVMQHNVRTVTSETTIKEVAEIFAEVEFHALPVVDHGTLTGIVTTTDLIRYLLEQY
jgi:CBS domain-containing protein